MRKLALLFLAGTLLTACVDKDYDLTDIDTDGTAIGDETTVFRMPLATVHVGMKDIAESGTDIRSIFAEADVWLPTELDNGCADIQRLINDEAYVGGLLDDLSAEMMTSDAKLRAVTNQVWEKYKDEFLPLIPGITGKETADEFYEAFRTAFRSDATLRELLNDEVRTLARSYITDLRVDDLYYDVDGIDISGDVVDMLSKNLDPDAKPGEKNSLCLYGEIASKLPVSLRLAPVFNPTSVTCLVTVNARTEVNEIPETQLFEEDLRQIVDGMRITIPVTLTEYYRGMGFDETTSEPQIVINLRLVKRGSLTFDF